MSHARTSEYLKYDFARAELAELAKSLARANQAAVEFAYEEDREKLKELSKRGDVMAMMEYIERGREIKIPCDMQPPRILK